MCLNVAGNVASFDAARGRLSRTMRSRKLQALDFIKRYFAEWGASPSLEEIGGALGVSRQRASELVHQLSKDLQIEHIAGKRRGITLIDRTDRISVADALLKLSEAGWVINNLSFDDLNDDPDSLTKNGLPLLPVLDHDPESGSQPPLG